MDLLHRFFQLHRLLEGRRVPVPVAQIEQALACSHSTAKRLIRELRNYGAPIEFVPRQGYRYAAHASARLPGVTLSAPALSALALVQHTLSELDAGANRFAPVEAGIDELLAGAGVSAAALRERVRIKRARHRGEPACLSAVMEALLQRRRLVIRYRGRGSAQDTTRDIAPQQLVRYRDKSYLLAWCYLRRDLRSFALERIDDARPIEGPCDEVPAEVLATWSESAYGIFNGPGRHTAVLRFAPERARWAADEHWHPRQEGRSLPDGSFELRVPYSDPTELLLDVMRLGDQIEVLEPPALREAVKARLVSTLARYA